MSKSSNRGEVTFPKYRWLVLFACWASFFLTSVDRSTWGPAAIFVGEDLGVPLASLGVFASAYYIGYVISNAAGGLLADVVGSRLTLSVSVLGAGSFMIVFGSTTSPAVGIAVQAMVGLFAGADYSAGVRLITSWFRPDELGRVLGLFLTATSVGLAAANLVVPSLIDWHGWQTSYHFVGVFSICVGVVIFLVVKPGPLGAPPSAKDKSTRRVLPDLSLVVRNRNLVAVSLAGFGCFWGTYGFVTWANALMIEGHNLSPQTAGLVTMTFAIAGAVSKPLVGFISDKFFPYRRKRMIMGLAGATSVLLFCFGALSSPTSLFWGAALLGFVAYGATTLMIALVPTLVPAAVVASAAGGSNAIWQLGTTIVPVAVGAVFATTGSFLAAFAVLAAGPFVGMLLMMGVKEPSQRDVTPATTELQKPRIVATDK